MSSKGKGKEVAGKDSYGKRKRDSSGGNDKTGGRKRKNPNVVQFFDDVAAEIDDDDDDFSDDSLFGDDFFVDEFPTELKVKSEPGKAHNLPFLPKEEEMNEEELDKMFEERYRSGSGFVTYAEDNYETKRSVQRDIIMPSAKEPTIWKVKCMVGREKHSAFCLMQKFVDLNSLGTKLQIISAFALEHIKGFIYMEADKQNDVVEACKGLCSIYSSRVALVPLNEISHLLSVRSKCNGVSVGMWARVKSGKYKGDLAQVVDVNDARKKATVKLLPRIDLQVMTEKFGGGVTAKKTTSPAPRLISSYELEEFRPLIQYRRDRDTNKVYEVLDGLMLKDGYLYKKVSIDSLSFWGVTPSKDELQMFESSQKDESDNVEWLSQLYGGERKKRNLKTEKGGGKGGKGGKGEGSSGSSMGNGFEVHDLVCFGRKDFGVIIGMEKDDYCKILKDSPGGPVLVSLESNELKTALSENKFTALDQRKKSISISDTVKILEGPLQGRQGIVKQIYRGTIFLYDENEEQNGGYFCSRSQMCEKVKLFDDVFNEKGGKSGTSGFEDFMSSPKSPLSPKKPWQARENNDFNRGDKEGMFSVGQSLRIRVGPLKGYLCRVLAIRRSDITVKLDSKQKVLTVKCEHLSEVRGKSSAFSLCEDPDSTSIKPFDMLGNQGCSTDWNGAGASAEGDGWNAAGGAPADGSSWPAFPASGAALEHDSANAFGSMDNDLKKDSEVADAAWDSRVTSNHNSSWGTVTDGKMPANSDQVGSWGNRGNCLNNATTQSGFGSIASGSWAKTELLSGDQAGSSKDSGDKWGNDKFTIVSPSDASGSWEKSKSLNEEGSWGKGKNVTGSSTSPSTWGKAVKSQDEGNDKRIPEDSWGKSTEKCTSINDSDGSRADWKSSSVATENQTRGWGNSGGSWSQKEAGNNDEASGWKKAKSNDSQAENWANKSNPGETKDFDGGKSNNSWNNEHTGGWSKTKDFDGGKGNNSWNKPNTSGEDNISNQNKGWGGGKEMGASGDKWNSSKAIDGDRGASGPSGSQSSGWNTPKVSQDMPSSWNPKSADIEKEVENKNSADGWNSAKTLDGGSAAGWGQSSGWKSGNGDAGGGRGGGGYGGDGGGRYGGRGGGGGGGGGGNCYKCGESGHFSRECPSAGGGGRGGGGGGGNCYKCGESGHFSRECPSAGGGGGGGGGGNCYKCGESGHFSRECPSAGSGGGGGGGGNCFKCGESGHFSRECPSAGGGGRGGGGGGGNCYKCGESGHFSRECPSAGGGGGGGGGNCYKCGESGHFSRECPSAGSGGRGGGGGGNCYKCGESGHFARECPSAGGGGGGGGGGSCYKCGESGHFARECPSAGGGGGGGSSAQAGGWGANKAGGWSSAHAGGWNKGPDSTNEGGSSKGQAGGWASGDNAAHTGRSKPEAGGWGSNQVGGSNSWNQSAGANETGDGKGQASGWGANKPGSSAQAGGWSKGPDSTNEGGGSKGQAGGWGANKAGSSSGAQAGGWNKGPDSTNEAGSNKGQAGGWGSGDNAQAGRSNPQAGGWGTNQVGGSNSWNQSAGANETGDSKGQATGWGANKSGSSAQAGGWNKGPDSTNGAGSSQGQAGGWGANKAGSSSVAQAGGWNKGPDSTNEAGSSKGQVGGWGSGDNAQAGRSNPEAGGWGANQVGGSNSWTQSAGANDTGDGKGQAGGWG